MSERIYESDIDPREEDGYILADTDLLSYDEWWAEQDGGDLPSGASRLLAPEEPDGEELYERRMQSLADYRPLREE